MAAADMEYGAGGSLTEATAAMEYWRHFDLPNRLISLEQSCLEMRESKTLSISGRKRLNELTKSFRSREKEEQVAMVTEVLKAYQEEIDQLSKRSKFSEAAFYSIYKSIVDAPDPSASLDGLVKMVASTSTHQLEIERLRIELAQYDEEFQSLKNQDVTIRRLEDQIKKHEESNEDSIEEEVQKRIAFVTQEAELKIAEAEEKQHAVERRLSAAIESMKQAQSSADRAQSQLFEVSSQAESRTSALLAEHSLLVEVSKVICG